MGSRTGLNTGLGRRAWGGFVWLVLVALLGACSPDSPTAGDPGAELVSEIGTVVEVHDFDDGSYTEYLYQQVHFRGDILLSEYRQAVDLIADEMGESEVVLAVVNYRMFPPSVMGDAPADNYFIIDSCAEANYENCAEGKFHVFFVEEGVVTSSEYPGYWGE